MNTLYLAHHGILGQKWGIRRFQNEDGTLTNAGKKRYHTESTSMEVAKAITNTVAGQQIATRVSSGYREDKKEIKSEYKRLKDENVDKEYRKQLKSDYKKTLAEARTAAAQAMYSFQSDAANQRIQSQSLGKAITKEALLGSYGSLIYDRSMAAGLSRSESIGRSFVASIADGLITSIGLPGAVGIGDYIYNTQLSKRK